MSLARALNPPDERRATISSSPWSCLHVRHSCCKRLHSRLAQQQLSRPSLLRFLRHLAKGTREWWASPPPETAPRGTRGSSRVTVQVGSVLTPHTAHKETPVDSPRLRRSQPARASMRRAAEKNKKRNDGYSSKSTSDDFRKLANGRYIVVVPSRVVVARHCPGSSIRVRAWAGRRGHGARARLPMFHEDQSWWSRRRKLETGDAMAPVASTSVSSPPRANESAPAVITGWGDDDPLTSRSPRSKRRLALAKAEVAAIAALVRGHVPRDNRDAVPLGATTRLHPVAWDGTGVRVRDRDRLGSHGTLARDRGGERWLFFDTHPDFVADTMQETDVQRCPHLVGNKPTRSPHVIVSERIEGEAGVDRFDGIDRFGSRERESSETPHRVVDQNKPTLRKLAHCCECWERLSVKRLMATTTCYQCQTNFPFGKTKAFPLSADPGNRFGKRNLHGASAAADAATAVDVCFVCAPAWACVHQKMQARDELNAKDALKNASADGAAKAFSKMPMRQRLAIVERQMLVSRKSGFSSRPSANNAGDTETPNDHEKGDLTLARRRACFVAGADDRTILDTATATLGVTHKMTEDTSERLCKTRHETFLPKIEFEKAATVSFDARSASLRYAEQTSAAGDDGNDETGNSTSPETSVIINALRRHGDDEAAAARNVRDASFTEIAAAFTFRTLGGAEETAARHALRDRNLLHEVLTRDGGSYPLSRRTGRFSWESAVGRISGNDGDDGARERKDSTSLFSPEKPTGRGGVSADRACCRDAVALARLETHLKVDGTATQNREAEKLVNDATARRFEKDTRRRKMERWAVGGVDFSEYATGTETVFETVLPGPTAKAQLETASVVRSGGIDQGLGVVVGNDNASGDPRFAKGASGAEVSAPRFAENAAAESLDPPSTATARPTTEQTENISSPVTHIAPRVAPVVEQVCVPIIETLIDSVCVVAKDPAATETRLENGAPSDARVNDTHTLNTLNTPNTAHPKPKKKPKKRASLALDVVGMADQGHALPTHPRAPRGSTLRFALGLAWREKAERRRLRNCGNFLLSDQKTKSAEHNAFDDENDRPGVPIPLRKELRMAQQLPFRGETRCDETGKERYSGLVSRDDGSNTTDKKEDDEDESPRTAAVSFATARARREVVTRDAHVALRGVTLGVNVPLGGSSKVEGCYGGKSTDGKKLLKKSSSAAIAAALSGGRVIAPIRIPFGSADAVTGVDTTNNTSSVMSLTKRRRMIQGLGLVSGTEDGGNATMTEHEAKTSRSALKREGVRRQRDALRLKGNALLPEHDQSDAHVEDIGGDSSTDSGTRRGRGIYSKQGATHQSTRGTTHRSSTTHKGTDFKDTEIAYHASVFCTEPVPSPLALASAANALAARTWEVRAVSGGSCDDNGDAWMRDTVDRVGDSSDRCHTLLSAASAKLAALATTHALKQPSPFPEEKHLRREDDNSGDSAESDNSWDTAGNRSNDTAGHRSPDTDRYGQLPTPIDSDDPHSPTLADLDDPPSYLATPTTSSDGDSSTDEETRREVTRNARFRDSKGRSLRLYHETGKEFPDNAVADTERCVEAGDVRVSDCTTDEKSILLLAASRRETEEAPDEKTSASPSDSPSPDSRRCRDDYQSRIARVDAIANREMERVTKRAYDRRDAAGVARRDESGSVLFSRLDGPPRSEETVETVSTPSRLDAPHCESTVDEPSSTPSRPAQKSTHLSVSFFFPNALYKDVANPNARSRVEKFVGREMTKAIGTRVPGVLETDVSVLGMSRGPPDAIELAMRADLASVKIALGSGGGTVDLKKGGTVDLNDASRANALAVHVAVRVRHASGVGLDFPTSLQRLKNVRAMRTPPLQAARGKFFSEPRDDAEARLGRRAENAKRWEKLRGIQVALAALARTGVPGVGCGEAAITGSAESIDALPSPPSPPPLLDLFDGDTEELRKFVAAKSLRDAQDARDEVQFNFSGSETDAAEEESHGRSIAWKESPTRWSHDRLDSLLQNPPIAFTQIQQHTLPLTKSPLEALAMVAETNARRLDAKKNQDTKHVATEIANAKVDPKVLRDTQLTDVTAARQRRFPGRRATANSPLFDGSRGESERVFVCANSVGKDSNRSKTEKKKNSYVSRVSSFRGVADENDEYVNPRLARVITHTRGVLHEPPPVVDTPQEPLEYRNPRLDRMKAAGRS